ncbi:M23 family metallopeptidase [Corynebacterium sp. L4756]|uniref:M23 family metallopeptidase n=1 Tax=unclassified Corynebacterium TaxID=2624378 RepID=UPI00374D36C9
MKRIPRAVKAALAVAAASGVGLATVSGATADTPALSLSVAEGSSTPQVNSVNGSELVNAAVGFVQSIDGVLNNGVVPTVERTEYGVSIVMDPSTIPGLAEQFAPADPSQLTQMQGSTPDGRTVVFPTTGQLTSTYGERWGTNHNGIDVANPIGTPIVSVMDGEVISSGPAQGYGNWIRVRHDNGEISVYGHMQASSLLVGVGERVTAGQQIASIGSEGQSTGPHLHFEIWPDGQTATDPQQWFAQNGINF